MTQREAALRMRLQGMTYARIGKELGVSRQRAEQILSPPSEIRAIVVERAHGKCQGCGLIVGPSGHVHHKLAVGLDCDSYEDLGNLVLLCLSCHRTAHAKPAPPRKRSLTQKMDAGAVKEIRQALGLTQTALADRLGIHAVTVRKWEAGMQKVGAAHARLLKLLVPMQR